MICSGILVVMLLLPTAVDTVRGRLFLGSEVPFPALTALLVLKHVLLIVSGLALAVFVFALWQRRTWGFLGINVIAAISLALVVVQAAVLGYHAAGLYLLLLALCSGVALGLSNAPAVRSYVGARSINPLVEALKWVFAVIVVLTGIAAVAAMNVSPTSARLRLQPYQELVHDLAGARLGSCNWSNKPRVCLAVGYALQPSAAGAIIERRGQGAATMAIAENAWDALAPSLGFDSGYELQSVLWNSSYIPLLYAALKQAMYADGIAVYHLHTEKLKAVVQVQPRQDNWQVGATLYLHDGTSFEMISAHRDRRRALHPILVAINAY